METFFYVWLPGAAFFLIALAILLWVIFWVVPWGKSISLRNKQVTDYQEMRHELNGAYGILDRIARSAEDDSMLEVQLGAKCLKEIKDFVNAAPKQLER